MSPLLVDKRETAMVPSAVFMTYSLGYVCIYILNLAADPFGLLCLSCNVRYLNKFWQTVFLL